MGRGRALIATVSSALALTVAVANARPTGEAAWERHAAMTTPRHEPAVTKSGGRVYVMGGFVEGLNTVPFVDVYDVASDSWSMGPPLPIAPNHAMAAAHAGVVYHLGGYLVALEQPTDRALALVDGTWRDLAPMPEPRAAGAAEFLSGRLYVVGGVGPGGVADDMLVYEPRTDRWKRGPGPSTAREHLTLVRRGRCLYAIGGRQLTYETTTATVERFNPRTRRWTAMPPLPFPAAGHVSAVTRSGLIVVAGGELATGPLSATVAFDFSRRRWVPLPPLDPARTGFGAAASGDRFFVFGGAGTDPGYYDLTESLDLSGIAS